MIQNTVAQKLLIIQNRAPVYIQQLQNDLRLAKSWFWFSYIKFQSLIGKWGKIRMISNFWVTVFGQGNLNSKKIVMFKVHIFWEGHKILRNLHPTFDWQYIGQK